jgi:leader peptidase (prepilin peptidase) / N-methyltransferase
MEQLFGVPDSGRQPDALPGRDGREEAEVLSAPLLVIAVGAVAGCTLTPRAVNQLRPAVTVGRLARLTGGVAGAVGALLALDASHQAGNVWWLAPLLTWAITLTVAANCDAWAQRMPTPILLTGALVVIPLLIIAAGASHDWRALGQTAAICGMLSLLLIVCWRFAALGFGDVSLGAFGGLGLGHATHHRIAVALGLFASISLTQALWTLARTRDRHATLPYGPALAAALLVAAT